MCMAAKVPFSTLRTLPLPLPLTLTLTRMLCTWLCMAAKVPFSVESTRVSAASSCLLGSVPRLRRCKNT